ncbi:MAG TPA: hypothetical protein VJ850_13345 [Candidatus Limnocylindrales bacterium]|nr:hypothetical protein [Candidatus Limnocylindrales bacterium]
MAIPIVLERGPKSKRFVAYSVDWPGWSRGAKTPEAAVETLEAYRARYRDVAERAGMARDFDSGGPLEIAEERVGTASVDFWAISFSASSTEQDPLPDDVLDRRLGILRAAWALFDATAARVSPELAKGPRGGGRERDEIVRHVMRVESLDFASGVGLQYDEDTAPIAVDKRGPYRDAYVAAIRDYNAGRVEKRMRSRTLPFLIRHSAFHTLDHAWEMQDRDLTQGT